MACGRALQTDTLIVASHNAGKVSEIADMMAPFGIAVKSAAELSLAEPEETGSTFQENAAIKALAAAKATDLPALSDDSGLSVDAIGGDPGVYTADWAEKEDGSGRDFPMAMQKVWTALEASGSGDRTARFICVLCLAWPDGHTEFFRGQVAGEVVWPPRGEKGFGYDPIFRPEGHSRTFGEMDPSEKKGSGNFLGEGGLSHRSRAFIHFAKEKLEGLADRPGG